MNTVERIEFLQVEENSDYLTALTSLTGLKLTRPDGFADLSKIFHIRQYSVITIDVLGDLPIGRHGRFWLFDATWLHLKMKEHQLRCKICGIIA